MPTRETIANEISLLKTAGQDSVRRRYVAELSQLTGRDTIVYFSSYSVQKGIPAAFLSVSQEDIQGFMVCLHGLTGDKLDLVLHSPGGSLEAADQIVQYLRSKYNTIRAIVPQNAMSAATMIACACDEIVMGRHSAIGPIDPQMQIPGPNQSVLSIPAHTILQDFDQARQEVAASPNLANLWVPKFSAIPPGYLNFCKQTIDLARVKVEGWLSQYMFKNADPTKAAEIASWLGDFNEHKTHGRPIGFDLASEKGLKVTRLEADQQLQERLLSVYHATMLTCETTACVKLIENQNGKGHYILAQAIPQGAQRGTP